MSNDQSVVGKYFTYPDRTGRRVSEGGMRLRGKRKSSKPDLPLVTIITVCFNSSRTIEQCIDSVKKQTYGNIEYIIIDGLSTDATLSLVQGYENFVDYYISEPDEGLYYAINKGINLANGDYILILNSDDWYKDNCVEELVKAKVYSCASFVSCLAQYVNHDGQPTYVLRHMPYDASLYLRMPLRHETMLISSDIYNEIGLYDERYKIIADYDLTVRLFDAGYTLYELQKPLLFFRDSGVSNTNRSGLFKERVELIGVKFPFLEKDELEYFSDLSKFKPNQLESLYRNHAKEVEFVNCLRLYLDDRKSVDAKWKSTSLNIEKPAIYSPIVSIILPVFNAEKTLNKCIDSILGQTFKEFEVLCIDDVSTDGSRKKIKEYESRDSRVVLYENKNNVGHGASRNIGVKLAKGAYIFHIDPDDTVPKNALEDLVKNATRYDSDMVKGAYLRKQLIHGEKPGANERKSLSANAKTIVNTSLKEMPELLDTTEGHWSYLYNSDFVKKISYPSDLKMGQDSIFIVNSLVRARTVTVIDNVVYHYCANPESAMNTFTYRKYIDALEWRRRAWHVLNNAGFSEIGDRLLCSYWSNEFFKGMALTVSQDQLFEFFSKIRLAFAEANLTSGGSKLSPFLLKVFSCILAGKDTEAEELLKAGDNIDVSISNVNQILHSKDYKELVKLSKSPRAGSQLRIATFSTFDHGGAGTGTQRRVSALRSLGVDARIYSVRVQSKHDYVEQLPTRSFIGLGKNDLVWKAMFGRIILNSETMPKSSANEVFSLPESFVDFRAIQEVIDQADVVHLHWVVGMLDYNHFADVVKLKPVVWTLADMNAFTGGCHYSEGCDEYVRSCESCHLLDAGSNLAHETWAIKKNLYRSINNLHVICPSQWLADRARKSSLFKGVPIHVIPNPLPDKSFTIVDKKIARIKLNLPLNAKLILFGADNLDSPRKGGDLLKGMVNEIRKQDSHIEFELVMFGGRTIDIGLKTHMLGNISEEEHLSLIYSAVDVFVFPSREDNSPLTVGESLLSGTPVVGFPVGNVPDIVHHKRTGYISEYLNVKSLADGILWAFKVNDDSAVIKRSIDCRLSVKNIHDSKLSAKRHIALYKKIIRNAV